MAKIENWSVCSGGKIDPYTPPEMNTIKIQGEVYGHESHYDGKRIVTSRIVKIEGMTVSTHSGSTYELGNPHPDYVKWCNENGHKIL